MQINLMKGDCLERMKEIPDKSVDMVLTDPPYGTTKNKWDAIIDFALMWKELKRITKSGKAMVLFGTEPFSSALRVSNISEYKYDWVWDKAKPGNPLVAKFRPLRVTEMVSVFCKGKHDYYPQMTEREKVKHSGNCKTKTDNFIVKKESENRSYTHYYPKDILHFSNGSQVNRLHPTQKPVALLEYLIKTYTLEGETVLDFTMGSGSTGVACKNLNRNFIGIERDEKYFEIAKNRIENA
jgi:DNA modification methylase